MRQIVLNEPGNFVLTDVEPPSAPKAGEALVKVLRVGICGTDLHAFRGVQAFFSYPRILGHELGVEVVETGPGVQGLSKGDICAVAPYLNCGECIACRHGKTNCCTSLQVLGVHTDGGMREYFSVPANKLLPSKKLSVDQLALVEMLGIGAHAVRRAKLEKDEWSLIIGAGPIGLATAQFALATGSQVVVMDINQQRLEFCKAELGVQHTVLLGEGRDPVAEVTKIVSNDLPTAVFEVTGNATSMMKSFELPAHGGRLIFVGHTKGDITFNNPNFHKRELTLMSSRNATDDDLRHVMQSIEEGKIDTGPWITHRASMRTMIDDFPGWLKPETGVIKAMLEIV